MKNKKLQYYNETGTIILAAIIVSIICSVLTIMLLSLDPFIVFSKYLLSFSGVSLIAIGILTLVRYKIIPTLGFHNSTGPLKGIVKNILGLFTIIAGLLSLYVGIFI